MTPSQIKLLADLRSGAVLANVKPLEWQDEERGANQPVAVPRYSHARTQIRYYNIHDARGARPNSPQFRWTLTADGRSLGPSDGVFSGFPSMAEAKAAAQADYEARILSTMSPSPDPASLAEMIEGLVGASLHHETGERITRKDLNNAYRMGQENARLAAELLPPLVSELQAENEKLREATDEAIRLARYQLNRGSEDMGIGESDTLRRMVAVLSLSEEAARALVKDHPNGQG